MCTDSKYGFEENSEYIIFNFKKDNVRKIEVLFKTQIDRNQIAIGDLQIFYTDSQGFTHQIQRQTEPVYGHSGHWIPNESDAVIENTAPSCVDPQAFDEKFDDIDIKVCHGRALIGLNVNRSASNWNLI